MSVSVNLQTVHPRKLAAVRREVAPGAVGSAWGPAVGKVWDFIRSQPGLWTHDTARQGGMFGVIGVDIRIDR
jgi:hypothetical protein